MKNVVGSGHTYIRQRNIKDIYIQLCFFFILPDSLLILNLRDDLYIGVFTQNRPDVINILRLNIQWVSVHNYGCTKNVASERKTNMEIMHVSVI